MSVYVVFDPYWDRLGTFADEESARAAIATRWPGAHVVRTDGSESAAPLPWDGDLDE